MPLSESEIARLRSYAVRRYDRCACGGRKQRASISCRSCAAKARLRASDVQHGVGGYFLRQVKHALTATERRRSDAGLCLRCGHVAEGDQCPACASELALGFVTPDAFEQLVLSLA